MREEEAVALAGMACMLVVYALIAVRDLPTLVGRVERLPSVLIKLPAAVDWTRSPRRRNALARYVGWTALTQFVPVVAVLADGVDTILGVAGAAELVAATGWTAFLLLLMRARSQLSN